MTKIQQIQTIIGTQPDDKWGPKSQRALDTIIHPQGKFVATKAPVMDRKIAPDAFLQEMVDWAKSASDDIFMSPAAVFSSVEQAVGKYNGIRDTKALMLEIMRVLAAFESSYDWNEGMDTTNLTSNTDETRETGAWQVSYNSRNFGQELKNLLANKGIMNGKQFQVKMKSDHPLAMEYIARLLCHTVNHNGPVKRHEIDKWLNRDAIAEFYDLL